MANSRNTRILFVLSFILRDVAYPRHVYRYAEKLCADFKKLKPSADALAELMLSYMENAIEFTHDFGDMSEQYYVSVEGNFAKTVEFIAKNGLWEKFDKRLQQCVSWASVCGYGFADGIDDIYEEARHRIVGE